MSGNPAGRPPTPPDILAARRVNRVEFERIANEFLWLSGPELRKRLDAPETTALELMIGMMIVRGTMGDPKRFNCLMDRMLGKTRTEPEPAAEKTATSFVQLVMEAEAAKKKDGDGSAH